MTAVIAGCLLLFALAAVWIGLAVRRSRRRRELLERPLPEDLRRRLEKDFPRLRSLPPELRATVDGYAQVLAEEKNFEACGGLPEVTDHMRLLICAQAALLIARLPKHRFYPELKSILVYPGAFRDRGRRRFSLPEEEEPGTRLGESWETGSVILSWDSVVAGARNADDGINVVLHEFAHQLDQVNGAADGLPVLHDRDAYRRWSEVFESSYDELVEEVEDGRGREPLIDPYGATDPAEFFAVATETFFEEPLDLREEHPDLYEELASFYGLDPVAWGRT